MRTQSIHETAAAVRSGAVSAERIVDRARRSIADDAASTRAVHAFLALAGERALERARALDRRIAAGLDPGPLAGVTVAIKDNLCTVDLPTTCGSRMLEDYHAPFEATAVRRLREAGAIIVGKTNMDEFAMGSSTENSAYGPTRNPRARDHIPGGSSGGSAAAVAAEFVSAALGSDTGGSVRQPAALCGVVGLKPTYGRVSRYGLIAFASSLDHVGVFGRSVADAAALLQTISGHDPLDSTSAERPVPELRSTGAAPNPTRLVVGIPAEYLPEELHPGVRQCFDQAADRLRAAGADLRIVSLPHTRYAIPAYYVIAPAEASSNLARYDGVRFGARVARAASIRDMYEETRSRGFGPEVKRRILLGTFALSAGYHERYYGRAQQVRARIAAEFERAFASGVDVLLTPTTPGPAGRLGEHRGEPYAVYLSDIFTVAANLAGLPALSLPIGEVGGLPIGGQLIAGPWAEPTLIRAGATMERALSG
ncbi:MAG: Asp-tRNA(Asn)/Glu-tRNA(Gln) amidotransferase subunit GatA [Longimicrobiales bacterium]